VYARDGSNSELWLQQDAVDGQYVVQLFKWIKQHLRIKAFYGTSENAVKTQIWIAVSVYVLVAIVRKRLELEVSLYQILQILTFRFSRKCPFYGHSKPFLTKTIPLKTSTN
jgi:high-affinity nickel permease